MNQWISKLLNETNVNINTSNHAISKTESKHNDLKYFTFLLQLRSVSIGIRTQVQDPTPARTD